MRAIAIFLSILLALPLVTGLAAQHAPAPPPANPAAAAAMRATPAALGPTPTPQDAPPFPADLRDADLVLLLARHTGLDPQRRALPPLPPDATVESLALKLAHRSGAAHATPADFAAFATLDPRIAAPTLTLLHALDAAWTLRDAAVAGIPPEDQRALATLILAGDHRDPRAAQFADPLDRTALVEAAILLLDAAESVAIPQLQEAAKTAPWPATPLADPIGILRIGGTGNDLEETDRLLQIDPRGNDVYRNNAGGTTLLADVDPETPDYPVALSVDFEGEDNYTYRGNGFAQGAGFLGVGVALDFEGDDYYDCLLFCHGSGPEGIGILRDYSGADMHLPADSGLGSGSLLGVSRDDAGDDTYRSGFNAGGFGFGAAGTGLLWDRDGVDEYHTLSRFVEYRYGWGEEAGRGYFVDEGTSVDVHHVSQFGGRACNSCTWRQGEHGHGNDGYGGLPHLLGRQESI